MHPNEGILRGVQATCQVCQQMTYEPMVCAGCGRFGHPACLGKEKFFDYFFCSRCITDVTAEYASFRDAQRLEDAALVVAVVLDVVLGLVEEGGVVRDVR